MENYERRRYNRNIEAKLIAWLSYKELICMTSDRAYHVTQSVMLIAKQLMRKVFEGHDFSFVVTNQHCSTRQIYVDS